MKNDKDSKADNMKSSKPTFKEANDIGPVADAKGKNPALETSLFGPDALGSEIATTPKYAKKGKGGMVDKGVFASKENQISPDGNY